MFRSSLCSHGRWHKGSCCYAHSIGELRLPFALVGGGNNKLWAESDALPGIKSHSGIDIWYGQDLAGKQLDRILWYARSEQIWPDWVKMLVWYVGGVYGLGKYEDWRFDDEAVDFNLIRRIAELRPVLGNRGAGRFRGAFWYHDSPSDSPISMVMAPFFYGSWIELGNL